MKKKLLFINGHMNVGGVEKSLLDILKHMDYDRYDVTLLLFESYGDYASEIPQQVHMHLFDLHDTYGSLPKTLIHCVKQRNRKCFRMRLIMQLAKTFDVRQFKHAKNLFDTTYDVVIAFRPGICTNIAAFAIDAPTKITWWHHGEYNLSDKAEKDYHLACQEMDKIVAVSIACSQVLVKKLPENCKNRITVIPNMIDTADIKFKASLFSPYTNSCPIIVSVGRLEREKHFENAIFAAQYLKMQGISDFHWYIVGDGSKRAYLEKYIVDADVADVMTLLGSCSNPYPYIANAALYVHPSYVESQGLAILEAMALGIPCVVTKSAGPAEFIQSGINGILTEPSPKSLAENVFRILTDSTLYEKIKANTSCPAAFNPHQVIAQININF